MISGGAGASGLRLRSTFLSLAMQCKKARIPGTCRILIWPPALASPEGTPLGLVL